MDMIIQVSPRSMVSAKSVKKSCEEVKTMVK